MKIWNKEWLPKRYIWITSWISLLENIVVILSLGWLSPDWTLKAAFYFAKRNT